MKFRWPFKDYALRWKDDATMDEKLFWGGISSTLGLILGNLISFLITSLAVSKRDVEDLP